MTGDPGTPKRSGRPSGEWQAKERRARPRKKAWRPGVVKLTFLATSSKSFPLLGERSGTQTLGRTSAPGAALFRSTRPQVLVTSRLYLRIPFSISFRSRPGNSITTVVEMQTPSRQVEFQSSMAPEDPATNLAILRFDISPAIFEKSPMSIFSGVTVSQLQMEHFRVSASSL